MSDRPETPADPRPGGEPYYIDSECPECGTELVLYDSLDGEQMRSSDALAFHPDSEEPWYDEWVCPNCLDGIHIDRPDEPA